MADDVDNLILEQVRKIRAVQDDHSTRFDQVMSGLNGLEKQVARIGRDGADSNAELVEDRHRLDAVVRRLERIERRLELTD